MAFDPAILDEIRARLPVSQVVARRVKLKRAGREWKGLSPFKQEKTPSFTVNDSKGFYHCFASGEHGDVFDFVMKTEGLSFPEAVERLAEEAGVAMPRPAAPDEARARVTERLHALIEASAAFYEAQLATERGGPARRYLDERGVGDALRARFRLGFAPNERFALKEHLAGLGFGQDEMAQAGMLVTGDDIAVSFDRFRNRIIFPISDFRGRPVAFGARALDPGAPAKYLNSPETPLFHKGRMLFNGHRARETAHAKEAVIAVEGYMDVIALTGAGFANVVAPLGTALSEEQMRLLWRMAPEPVLCFDGDEAGRRAAFRAIDTALAHLRPGFSLAFAFLPAGADPDDVVRRSGAAAFREVLDKALPLAEVLWMRESGGTALDTPERRAALEARLRALLQQIAEPTVRRHYAQDLAARLKRLWQPDREAARGGRADAGGRAARGRSAYLLGGAQPWQKGRRAAAPPWAREAPPASESLKRSRLVREGPDRIGPREALLLLAVLNHPWLMDFYAEEWAEIPLQSPVLEQLRAAMLRAHALNAPLDSDALHTQLRAYGLEALVSRAERAISHKSDGFIQPRASREDVEAGWLQIVSLHRKSCQLQRELEAAERAFQADGTDQAFERLCDIRRQLDTVEEAATDVEGWRGELSVAGGGARG